MAAFNSSKVEFREKSDCPEALQDLGMSGSQLEQRQTDEKYFGATSQVQPDSVETWFSLGNLCLAQKQFPEAVTAYRQALVLRPDSLAIYNNLGYTLQQQGLLDEAINYYQKALDLKPNFTEAEANLGNALQQQGKLSNEQELYYAQLNHKLGLARKKTGDLKTAITYYRQAIALQPDLLEAYYNLGVALQEQGELEEALTYHQQALELNPDFGDVYLSLGKIYQNQNNLKEAISAYRQGLKLINPRYAAAVEVYQDSETIQEVPTTPPIPQGEVIVGEHKFPAIFPVEDDTGKRPFWTVIILVYERTTYLLECLTSVLAQWQGEEDMEILVMDNASTEPIFELVNSIGKGVVRYYRNPENIGAVRNHNAGIALSRGQWIHVLHDDDYVLPGFYSQLKQSLEKCSGTVGAAFTGYENIDGKGKIIFSNQVYGEHRGIAQDWLQLVGIANPLNMVAVVILREAHERVGGYHPELTFTCDWELYKRIASVYDWWCEPAILAHYRQHSNNITNELFLSGKQGSDIRYAIEFSESYLPANLCLDITAKARSNYFNSCLVSTKIPLSTGNVTGAFYLLQEALKIDRSPQAIAKLFSWLTRDEVAPLREEIISKLLSIPVDNT
jgi:tetratricopeptide (TPR) repeat protein/glycosyltransferase involved in cell wall biosynthesis